MTVRFERPVSRAAFLARRLASFSFLMFLAAWGLHRFGPLDTPSFVAILLACAVISAFAVYLGAIGLAALWYKGAQGGKASAAAIAISACR